jgi:hypothetical protein
VPLPRRFPAGPHRMLMAAYIGAINEDRGGRLTALSVEARPELAPDAARLRPAAAVVDGVPMATFDRRIPPGEAGAGETQHRFDEPTEAQLWGLPALGLIAVGRGSISAQVSSMRSMRTDIGVAPHGLVIEATVRRSCEIVHRT